MDYRKVITAIFTVVFFSIALVIMPLTACNKDKSKTKAIPGGSGSRESVKSEKIQQDVASKASTAEKNAQDPVTKGSGMKEEPKTGSETKGKTMKDDTGNPILVMKTSMGNIKIELDRENAPITVKNFMRYVEEKYYDGTIFHRIIDGFMIQGGGLTEDMKPKETMGAIKNEAFNGLKNKRGTLAMARTGVVDSATSQFFINVADNDFLDHRDKSQAGFGYAVFGKVIEGMDIVDKIKKVQTIEKRGVPDVPAETVIINSVTRVE